MKLEDIQRKFTRMIDGIGLLSYKERLDELSITTLIERRARGDLIECYKIFKGIADYGNNLLNVSRSGYNLVRTATRGSRKADSFPERCINYWNKLPDYLKDADNVDSFKKRLEYYKIDQIIEGRTGNYWELSSEMFQRTETGNRDSYVQYLMENPGVAARRKINIR